MSLLQIENISTGYGKKQILFDVSLEIKPNESVLLVGSNGSGKSTLFKAIYGLLDIWEGRNKFDNQLLHNTKQKTPTDQLIHKGLMYIPQKNELFDDLNVAENLKFSLLHLDNKAEAQNRLEDVFTKLPVLKEKHRQTADRLSGGERKMLSLGMVLANKPKILLYDEPLAGLSSLNVELVVHWLNYLKQNGTTLVLIEHRIKELINLADRIIGLKLGIFTTENLNDLETIKQFLV